MLLCLFHPDICTIVAGYWHRSCFAKGNNRYACVLHPYIFPCMLWYICLGRLVCSRLFHWGERSLLPSFSLCSVYSRALCFLSSSAWWWSYLLVLISLCQTLAPVSWPSSQLAGLFFWWVISFFYTIITSSFPLLSWKEDGTFWPRWQSNVNSSYISLYYCNIINIPLCCRWHKCVDRCFGG